MSYRLNMIINSRGINRSLVWIALITAGCFFTPAAGRHKAWAAQNEENAPSNDYNIILIAINNVGAEHMSLYGYNRATTPKIDAWARDALVFENAYTPVSWTLPAITSVFTSLHPFSHKVLDRYSQNVLPPGIKVLPQILRENNYATAAFTGGLDNIKIFDHMRGFETISQNPSFTGFGVTFKQAEKWLAKNSRKKFFLFIHGYDAHPPFTPPAQYRGVFAGTNGRRITINPEFTYRGFQNSDGSYLANCLMPKPGAEEELCNKWQLTPVIRITRDDIDYLKDLYDEEVLSVDSLTGKFLDSLDRNILKKTIIVIFSEHGEMFAKHGRLGRAGALRGTLYDEVVHVPLLMKIPGKAGRRIHGLAQLIDILPTLTILTGIQPPANIQGKSLLPLIETGRPINDYIYSGASYNFAGISKMKLYRNPSINETIRDFDWKFMRETIFSVDGTGVKRPDYGLRVKEENLELYDLKNDPDELRNVIGQYPGIADDLRAKLEDWSRLCRNFIPAEPQTRKIPEEIIEDARRNGYW